MHHSKRNVYKTLVLVWAEFTAGSWLLLTMAPHHTEVSIDTFVQLVSLLFCFNRNSDIAESTAIRLQELRKSDE
jgi:hypothetical protein